MWSFLCPNGTIFNQEIFTCVWWFDFDCDTAAGLYDLNDSLYEAAPEGQQRPPARPRPQQPRDSIQLNFNGILHTGFITAG